MTQAVLTLRATVSNPLRGVHPKPEVIPGVSDHIIEATGVRKLYDTGRHRIEALAGVDLTVSRGEVVAVMGPSGCG